MRNLYIELPELEGVTIDTGKEYAKTLQKALFTEMDRELFDAIGKYYKANPKDGDV